MINNIILNNISNFKIGNKDVKLYLGNVLLNKYEPLEYISSTATGGLYINLGCKLLEDTADVHIDIKFRINGTGKDNASLSVLFGNQGPANPWPGFNLRIEGSYLDIFAKWEFTNSKLASGRYYHNLFNRQTEKIDNYNIYKLSWTLDNIPSSQINSTLNTCLFCNAINTNSAANFINADLYYCKITKGDLCIELIPVKNKETNEVGLYDIWNNHFYTSEGDEPFIGHAFPSRTYKGKYRRLEFVRSTKYGAEYIDLGTKFMETNENVRIDIKFEFLGKGINDDKQSTLLKFNQEDNSVWPGFCLRKYSNNELLEFVAKHNFTGSLELNSRYYYLFNGTTRNPSYGNGIIFEESIVVDNIPDDQLHSTTTVIFASHDDNNDVYWRYSMAKIYYLKLYKGGVLIHDLVPVSRNSDNVAGLYDNVSKTFFTSNGANELLPGPMI